jgi:hypothetical protein
LGGTNVDFIHHYSDLALRIIEHPLNQAGWARVKDKMWQMTLIEQYFLSACVEYHRAHKESPFNQIEIQYMFNTNTEMSDRARVAQAGYTHLLGQAKRNPQITKRLELRVQTDFPDQYHKCLEFLQNP